MIYCYVIKEPASFCCIEANSIKEAEFIAADILKDKEYVYHSKGASFICGIHSFIDEFNDIVINQINLN